MVKRALLIVAHLSLLGFLFPDLRRSFGSWALALLLGILFLSPLSKLFRVPFLLQLMGLRRELGIFMAYLATVHSLGYLLDSAWASFFITPYILSDPWLIDSRYLLGLLAYVLTLPLLFTSNNMAIRFLGGRNWKWLHRLVYPLLFLTLFHKFLRPGSARLADIISPTIIFLGYLCLKVVAENSSLLPVQRFSGWIVTRYQAYPVTPGEGSRS